jgi:hypothetical protein
MAPSSATAFILESKTSLLVLALAAATLLTVFFVSAFFKRGMLPSLGKSLVAIRQRSREDANDHEFGVLVRVSRSIKQKRTIPERSEYFFANSMLAVCCKLPTTVDFCAISTRFTQAETFLRPIAIQET